MRVLLVSYAEKTHFLSSVPMGWALRTAGHEVRVATQPELAGAVAATGLTVVPVGADHSLYRHREWARRFGDEEGSGFFDMGEVWPELGWEQLKWGYREVVWWWWRTVNGPMVDDLTAYCLQWRPDLVIWEPGTYAGAIAAKASGAAHARLLWSVDLFGLMREAFLREVRRRPPEDREDVLAQWTGGLAARTGGAFSEDLTSGHFTITHMPPSLRRADGLRYVPMRYIPYNGRAVVPDWLREPPGRPRVCLSLGLSATERLGRYSVSIRGLLDALGDLDIEVVATVPPETQAELGAVPANTRLVSFVPLHALLPTCSAVINHGGPGTVCTSAFYGVPQLILPRRLLDDRLVARGLADEGMALMIPSDDVTEESTREHLLRLLDDPLLRQGPERLRQEMLAMPSPNAVVPELELLTELYRGTSSVAHAQEQAALPGAAGEVGGL
ncbi:activator-dependent family glycosyltransferase [Nonomuraea sp. SYSU D8015]|uniref:activator-dependent family glycosyltransferase n=1 Tax=Nonomuraea sp. SYSU D8015 TaxID=2593644 RepID=UPI00166129D6|nr:activator-dependent family glycosyltransferase [Nonomuraea sp. SYSU D8015]